MILLVLASNQREALNKLTFIILDENQNNVLKTKAVAESFQGLEFLASASTDEEALDCILEYKPDLVFLGLEDKGAAASLSLGLINELYRFLPQLPRIIVTANDQSMAYEAIKYGIYDYLLQPVNQKDIRKTLARLNRDLGLQTPLSSNILFEEKVIRELVGASAEGFSAQPDSIDALATTEEFESETALVADEPDTATKTVKTSDAKAREHDQAQHEVSFSAPATTQKPLVICVKSYGDYRYIQATDICYLQADNNSTDIHLHTGEMITAFKTLKHFEGVLKYPFVRIHNSYIVNTDYVSRIHTGNAVCHIKDSTNKLPFSKSYKENIDAMISTIASGNYLEI